MLALLETGKALYVLAAICLLGICTRMMTKNLYKRLWKESANLAAAKNKGLKELKTRAENTYRMNQGMRDSGAWLEHQLGELRFRGMTLNGWNNLSTQLTWLCLLAGGAGAFLSYWYRLDTYYIVLYGGGAVLLSMVTMLFDNGSISGRREQLAAALQDYLENVLCPRLARNQPLDEDGDDGRAGRSGAFGRAGRAAGGMRGTGTQNAEEADELSGRVRAMDRGGQPDRGGNGRKRDVRNGRRETAAAAVEETRQENRRDIDALKRSLEQIAASREKNRGASEDWLKQLSPEEMQLIGDILKEYLV